MKLLILACVAALALSLASFTQANFSEARLSIASPPGRVYGPADVMRRVYAQNSYTDYIRFRGNETARIVVEGDGDCDLDLYVYNPEGQLVAYDDDNTDYCVVSWTPNYTKSYTVVVRNRSNVYADYRLTTN